MGAGDELIECVAFDSARRHGVQLVARLEELLDRHGLKATDLDEVYVSAGPGSFTGLRIGITVAGVLAQSVTGLRCVAVPTVDAVAENAAQEGIDGHIGVIMDAKDSIYAAITNKGTDTIIPPQALPEEQKTSTERGNYGICPLICTVEKFLADAPRPITLLGEGLGYHRISGEGVTIADESLWLPRPEGVWRVGRRLACRGKFARIDQIRPFYLRRAAAEDALGSS